MPACRQTGVLKKMGQWFIGKISLEREVNKWIIAFKTNTPIFKNLFNFNKL